MLIATSVDTHCFIPERQNASYWIVQTLLGRGGSSDSFAQNRLSAIPSFSLVYGFMGNGVSPNLPVTVCKPDDRPTGLIAASAQRRDKPTLGRTGAFIDRYKRRRTCCRPGRERNRHKNLRHAGLLLLHPCHRVPERVYAGGRPCRGNPSPARPSRRCPR